MTDQEATFTAKGETQKMAVRVPRTLLDDLDDEVDDRGFMSRSEFVRKLLYDAIGGEG